jgi:endonuclease/exonuclease/phosphatase family metal-dependent hydrolase
VPEELRGTDQFLDVVTWNIRFFHDRDPARVEDIARVLATLNADIVVCQEILDGSLDAVAQKLREAGAGYYQTVYGTTGGNQRVALMWDLDWVRSKDEVREVFGRGQVVTADGKDAFPRLPLWGAFTVRPQEADGEPFDLQLLGLHLKSQRGGGETQRTLAADWLAAWLENDARRYDTDVVLLGDWNESPAAAAWAPFREMEEQGEVLFSAINGSHEISHLYYKSKTNLGSRLDLTLISSEAQDRVANVPQVVRWTSLDELLSTQPTGHQIKDLLKQIRENLSDHMPVVTRFYMTEVGGA